MSTPRTDAACGWPWGHHGRIESSDLRWSPDGPFVHSEVARQLERAAHELEEENRRLHVELDAYHNGEQLRMLRAENSALQAELEAQAVVNGKGSEREAKLLAENAALRTALNDFRSLSFTALLAPVSDCRPHYDLVKKHWAFLNNKLDREVKP